MTFDFKQIMDMLSIGLITKDEAKAMLGLPVTLAYLGGVIKVNQDG